ncbi:MAG: DNA polymerase III subunit gamma/tau [Pseudomonadales bacterium]|nr:DNA polymerase III subunit gamma/tau [Pseudomonadales bacterium]
MTHQVLARKWRPRSFSETVGQELAVRALVNALDNQRLHHAYLFTGTRGVGKTTIARILAKCLNCETGITSQPCGECSACVGISEGRFVDLIEVDAASRTKVEDTRELLENVQYAPSAGRYKVYLIDEVHMLSNHSFNALLKTLEEPPPHAMFLFATTDPKKLPVTILSRCLQFNLKRIMPETIAGQLQLVLEQEQIQYDEAALKLLSRAADGSMRDALSLTDQALAFGAGEVRDQDVRMMLGTIDRDIVRNLLEALLAEDAESTLNIVQQVSEHTSDYISLLADLISWLHQISVVQMVPGAIDENQWEPEVMLDLARRISPEDLQLYYQIALTGRRDLPDAPDMKSGLEMVLLRMLAFRPGASSGAGGSPIKASNSVVNQSQPIESKENNKSVRGVKLDSGSPDYYGAAPESIPSASDSVNQGVVRSARQALASSVAASDRMGSKTALLDRSVQTDQVRESPHQASVPIASPAREDSSTGPQITQAEPVGQKVEGGSQFDGEWASIVEQITLQGVSRMLAINSALESRTEECFFLLLGKGYSTFLNSENEQRIAAALSEYVGKSVRVQYKVQDALEAYRTPSQIQQANQAARQALAVEQIEQDPNVQQLVNQFSGKIDYDSIEPLG